MRFAYIDSHGNEVPIPSVDALALRIELGAIGPETQLYDAQADLWGPAHTHEIFHTLSRDLDDKGFVAPPPPVVPAGDDAETESPVAAEPKTEPTPSPPEPEPEPEAEPEPDPNLGLTLAEPPPEEEAEDVVEAAAGDAVEGQDGGFDFGDLSGGLELEAPLGDEEPMDLSPSGAPDDLGGMGLETEMEFSGPPEGFAAGGGDLQLEQPMSEFQPDSPPGWMEASEPEGDDDLMDFSTVTSEVVAEPGPSTEPSPAIGKRRAPKDRPSPPKFKKRRSAAPILFTVLVLALGVAGYVGWPILSARLAERSAPERPPVVMPVIPEDLLPQMRALAEAAIADVVEQVDGQTVLAGAPDQPGDEWLGGQYLGNASQFAGVETFWESLEGFVVGLRAAEWQAYRDRYSARLSDDGVDAETSAMLLERADSGLVATEDMREQSYAQMDRVVVAALDLHDFLLQNEANIEYRPAATSTADPVLEAVPSSQAIGDEMWARVDDVTDALGALGTEYPFTRERLIESLLSRLQEVGFR